MQVNKTVLDILLTANKFNSHVLDMGMIKGRLLAVGGYNKASRGRTMDIAYTI